MSTTQHPIEQHEQMMDTMQKQITDHEERIRALQEFSVRSDEQTKDLWRTVGRIEQMLAEIKSDIDKIREKPARRWESLIGYVLSGVVMLIIAYVGKVIFP